MKKLIPSLAAMAVALMAAPAFADSDCASACGSCGGDAKAAAMISKAAEAELGIAKGGAADVTVAPKVGHIAPDFTLTDTKGNTVTLSEHRDKVNVVVFYNQACPFVVEMWDRLGEFTETYSDKGVNVLAIDPGVDKPTEEIVKHAANRPYPILVNRESTVARTYQATRTPEVFVVDNNGIVRYHGAFDNGQEGSGEGARKSYVEDAVKAVLAGEEVKVTNTRAFGCTIKWNNQTAATESTTDGASL